MGGTMELLCHPPDDCMRPLGFCLGKQQRKLMFADAMWFALNIYGSGCNPAWDGYEDGASDYDYAGENTNKSPNGVQRSKLPSGAFNTERTIAWRHRNGANVCFFDGHVAWMNKADIYKPGPGGTKLPNYPLWNVMDSAAPVGPP